MLKNKETLVILPYSPKYASGDELRTSVEGWHKHFKSPMRLVVIGERSRDTEELVQKGLIEHVERASVWYKEGPELEFASIARYVVDTFSREYTEFIKTDDDIYPVNDFTLQDCKTLKWIGSSLGGNPNSPNHFQRAMYRTTLLLEKENKPILNYCSHAPRVYNTGLLAHILDKYPCEQIAYLLEPLYFNYYYHPGAEKIDVNAARNPLKFGIYSKVQKQDVIDAINSGVKWVNNSAPYYAKDIIDVVRQHNESYPLPKK